MEYIIEILKYVAALPLVLILVAWVVHIFMVKDHCKVSGKASYRNFKREFAKHKWEIREFKDSLFSDTGGYIHADVFKFNDKGMYMKDPVSYVLCKLHILLEIKKLNKDVRFDWNKEQSK
ncbi:hypothetical protein [Bacillus sp. AG4(2022)]|uniref:hypothetical protein n=1 Tax=Bacillus sp. AG4(2022) TaxID=2962594 RepID=UPI0028828F9F|nr:hypothetical protein [Bacillus sp. AG4(2022)]MDT0160387.1 hypothetical protein [Bacillus sp. AG4(2022)]